MRKSSIIQKQKDSIKRTKIILFIDLIILAASLWGIITAADEKYRIVSLLIFGAVFWFAQFSLLSLLGNMSTLRRISINQSHEYDEKGISVSDEFKGELIESSFEWTEIKYMEEKSFSSVFQTILGHKRRGIMMIADKKTFYKGLNRKDRTLNKLEKLKTKLSGGLFIQCTDDEFDEIRNYWGGKIYKDIY